MCGFSFTVFLSAFQLLPTAPFHILALGGSTAAAGLFLGFLTYASAFSAPVTGTLADRAGTRRMLIIASVAITVLLAGLRRHSRLPRHARAGARARRVLVGPADRLGGLHDQHPSREPPRRRDLAYWGLSTIAAIAVAPTIGFWMFQLRLARALRRGRGAQRGHGGSSRGACRSSRSPQSPPAAASARLVEWRVLILSFTLFLYSFGYGGITSFTALYADANGVTPKGIYLTTLALVDPGDAAAVGTARRSLWLPAGVPAVPGADRRRAGVPRVRRDAVLAGAVGGDLRRRASAPRIRSLPATSCATSAAERRGAAFGAILACFDTGIGTGSTAWAGSSSATASRARSARPRRSRRSRCRTSWSSIACCCGARNARVRRATVTEAATGLVTATKATAELRNSVRCLRCFLRS